MRRNIQKLVETHFDVLIVGGGIYGAAIAREASRSGYKIALIEKGDFCHATSANSLKILHGGLRYLQRLNIRRMRRSIAARREMTLTAPHLVKPLKCLIPLYGHGAKGREAMFLGLLLNDLISSGRNRGLSKEKRLSRGKLLSRKECLARLPGISQINLRGAAMWCDALAVDTERLGLEFVMEAADRGACVANYVEARGLRLQNRVVDGVEAWDVATGAQFDIRAQMTVNAAGPWAADMMRLFRIEPDMQRWAKAINVIVDKPLFGNECVGIEGPDCSIRETECLSGDRRYYFFVPWKRHTMIGTGYSYLQDAPDRFRVEKKDIQHFLQTINMIYPPADLQLNDVTSYHGGMLPAAAPAKGMNGPVLLENRSLLLDHRKTDGIEGVISIVGVKYTTAPMTALAVTNVLLRRLEHQKKRCFNRSSNARGQLLIQQNSCCRSTAPENLPDHLLSAYGPRAGRVLRYDKKDDILERWINNDPPLLRAEVLYFIHEEMAMTLSDIVFRRTNLGAVNCPSEAVLRYLAEISGQVLGWDEAKKEAEIEVVMTKYAHLEPKDAVSGI